MQVKEIEFKSAEQVIKEIRDMSVKGGSPFGRSAAWAFKLACEQEHINNKEALINRIKDLAEQMTALKPTMGTIHNSCALVERLYEANKELPVEEIKKKIIYLCNNIITKSLAAVDQLAEIGAKKINNGSVIMMHSYSSSLMGIFIKAAEQGKKFTVICTESRPLRESRLAVKYLQGLDEYVTYITDAEIYEFMPTADFVIMGADTLCCDGAVANKIGTAMIAKLAQSCKKPVYIASELYKYDPRTKDGYDVVLERRDPNEIISAGDFESEENIEVVNQFFDLTPARDITALICEYGCISTTNVDYYWHKLESDLLK